MPNPANWILAATTHGPMVVNRHDAVTDANGTTYGVGHQLLTTGIYDAADLELQLKVLDLLRHYRAPNGKRPIVALDGGANVGAFTVPWAKHLRGWGYVVAVEPQDQVFYALCANVVLNNLDNAHPVHAALTDQAGWTSFPRADFGQAGSYGSIGLDTAKAQDCGQELPVATACRAETVDGLRLTVNQDFQFDLIKLDLEGGELQALAGCQAQLQASRPVLLVEHLKCGWPLIKELLEPHGYTCLVDTKDVWAIPTDDPLLPHFVRKDQADG